MNWRKLFVLTAASGVVATMGVVAFDNKTVTVGAVEQVADAGADAGVIRHYIQYQGRWCDADMMAAGSTEHEACAIEQPSVETVGEK